MGNSALEFAVLAHLAQAELIRSELARRTGTTDVVVQRAIHRLISAGLVYRRDHGPEPSSFTLTSAGFARAHEQRTAPGKVIGAAAPESPPRRRRRMPAVRLRSTRHRLPLTDEERRLCGTALAEHFGAGRIDIAELERRTDLLSVAVIRSDLRPVFDGLPAPSLVQQSKGKPAPGWRSGAAGCTSIVSVFFGLIGLALISGHDDVDDVVVGLLLVGGAVVWNYLVWSWARRRVN